MMAMQRSYRVARKVNAVCEWATYDVWGNARDGFQVNDVYRQGEITILATVTLHNAPGLPTGGCSALEASVLFTYSLSDRAIRKALGASCTLEIDSDGTHYTINRARDGKPLAEITILRFEDDPDA